MAVPAKPSVLVTKSLLDGQRGTFINFVHFSDDVYFHIHVDFAFHVAFIPRVASKWPKELNWGCYVSHLACLASNEHEQMAKREQII